MDRQKGYIYIIVLMVILILSLISLALASIVMSDYRIALADDDSQSAYYIAEGGAAKILYALMGDIERVYDQLTEEAQRLNEPTEEYVKQNLYSRLPQSYPPPGYEEPRFDAEDGKVYYTQSSAEFDLTSGEYTILVTGHVNDAVSKLEIVLKVNRNASAYKVPSIFDKAVITGGAIVADRSDITITGDVIAENGLRTANEHHIMVIGEVYTAPGAIIDPNVRIVDGNDMQPEELSDAERTQLESIFNDLKHSLDKTEKSTGSSTLEDPEFIRGRQGKSVTLDKGFDNFIGFIYSDDQVIIKENKDTINVVGTIMARNDIVSDKQNPFEGAFIVNYNSAVINNLAANNQDFKRIFSSLLDQSEGLIEIEKWREVR